ncbi:hypothetical protein N658DRAFT_359907 [Parathielavia hyrcaniae]|uniref:Uncharacterized protein n=1 Tax=Parathielavia hyrcaniae TaxID=113614 RepID=A0AAN6Q2L0_9PEZI|nr:hypothetical protein N658DRAFT_359907 [Parathielavia hyrcaniae]
MMARMGRSCSRMSVRPPTQWRGFGALGVVREALSTVTVPVRNRGRRTAEAVLPYALWWRMSSESRPSPWSWFFDQAEKLPWQAAGVPVVCLMALETALTAARFGQDWVAWERKSDMEYGLREAWLSSSEAVFRVPGLLSASFSFTSARSHYRRQLVGDPVMSATADGVQPNLT